MPPLPLPLSSLDIKNYYLSAVSGTVAQGDPQQLVLVQLQQKKYIWPDHNWLQVLHGEKELFQMLYILSQNNRLGKPLEVSHPTTTSVLLRALFGKLWNCVRKDKHKKTTPGPYSSAWSLCEKCFPTSLVIIFPDWYQAPLPVLSQEFSSILSITSAVGTCRHQLDILLPLALSLPGRTSPPSLASPHYAVCCTQYRVSAPSLCAGGLFLLQPQKPSVEGNN